ncbi:hypothetical protein KAR91_49770 [Candidatus Pacearchaeota archaeon]|nr:hypothetical protein [Candidatus Pacearchaeota archaeon]
MHKNNILVIGDAMIDSHICGTVSRISPEAPVPVLNANEETYTLGGAANVAAQVAAVADKTILMYKNLRVAGAEDKILGDLLDEHGIKRHRLWMDANSAQSCVPIKKRIWAGNQQICRVDRENTQPPTDSEYAGWFQKVEQVIKENDINKVIFSDYDKGTLTDQFIENVSYLCMNNRVLTILDPKRHTFPDIPFLTVVKPNEMELISTGHDNVGDVSNIMDNTFVVQTRANKSTNVAQYGDTIGSIPTQQVEVIDVCGAGDVHVAILALKFNGGNIKQAIRSANAAAAISVQHRGCYTLTTEEVNKCLKDYNVA